MIRLSVPRVMFVVLIGLGLAASRIVTGATADTPARATKSEATLTPAGETGVPFEVVGTLLALPDSFPVRDAQLYAYHADASGRYMHPGERHPHLEATVRTDVLGHFRIHTVLPGIAEGSPHIHFLVRVAGSEEQMRTVTLCRHVGAGSDTAYAKLPWMLVLPTDSPWAYAEPAPDGGYRAKVTFTLDRHGR